MESEIDVVVESCGRILQSELLCECCCLARKALQLFSGA